MTNETAALVAQLRDALRHIDAALDPDDWAGEQRMLDITRPAIAAADEWLAQQRGPLTETDVTRAAFEAGFSPMLIVSDGGAFGRLVRIVERAHGIGTQESQEAPK